MDISGKYLDIARVQIKLTLRTNTLLALGLVAVTPVVFSIRNLDSLASSLVLERFVALSGIVLCTPLFSPEQDHNIKEVVESKLTPLSGIYVTRLILATVALVCILTGFIGVMLLNDCQFAVDAFIFGTFATAYFLGSIGFAAYSLFDNMVVGYMLPLGYYMLNLFSGAKLGNFYLFSLEKGSLIEKYWQFAGGMILFASGIVYRSMVRRIR
ncbi:hypothetical protein [Paenibacillus sp. A14]|uniref:hypothetical protein n=1 Tax=Paenibacillus sp. A14 TaxID=3119820 RepID=UPI002FE14AA2